MPNLTTLNETQRSPIDGTEWIRLATTGANWRGQLGTQTWVFGGVAGGSAANSTLTLESTTGAGTTDAIVFLTGSQNEKMRINNSGAVMIGHTGVIQGVNGQSMVDIVGTGNDTTSLDIARFSADLAAPFLTFTKSGSGTKGNQGLVDASANIGIISFEGSDGTNFLQCASIVGRIDGLTPGTNDMPGRLVFSTTTDGQSSPAERLRIDNSGNIVKCGGGSAAQSFHGVTPGMQVLGGGDSSSYVQCRYSNDAFGSALSLAKSRNTTPGSFTIVSNNDSLGYILWHGDNGVDLSASPAQIGVEMDGAPSSTSLPTRMLFKTTPAASTSPSTRMTIANNGNVAINKGLTVNADQGATANGLYVYQNNFDYATYQGNDNSSVIGFKFIVRDSGGSFLGGEGSVKASTGGVDVCACGNNQPVTLSTNVTANTPTTRVTVGATLVTLLDGLARGIATKTADFTVADTDTWLINNKSGSTCTVTMPTASSYTGREIWIKSIQAFTTVSASSNVVPKTGGGAGTAILPATSGAWAALVSDGTNWQIFASGT